MHGNWCSGTLGKAMKTTVFELFTVKNFALRQVTNIYLMFKLHCDYFGLSVLRNKKVHLELHRSYSNVMTRALHVITSVGTKQTSETTPYKVIL